MEMKWPSKPVTGIEKKVCNHVLLGTCLFEKEIVELKKGINIFYV